jgi:hypothetical protein
MKRKMRAVEKSPPVTEFREGDLARNKKFGWVGFVRVVECGICATPYKDGNPTCPHREFPSPLLSIEQGGFLKPWCLPDRFEPTAIGPSVWEWLLRPAV